MTTEEHFLQLAELLKIEKEADFQQYQDYIQNTSINQQKEKGICWYPLNIKEQGYGLGDYPYLIVERNAETPHQFSGGNVISFFSMQDESTEEIQGTVHYVNRHEMKINFLINDLPDWVRKGKIGVRLFFDERTFNEMNKALAQLINKENKRALELAKVFLGINSPYFRKEYSFELPLLNESQNKAVQNIINTEDVSIVHGPPGTGKTTTLVEAIHQLAKHEGTILVTAPSNAAVDLLTEKLATKGLDVLRIGNLSRIDEKIVEHTLEQKISLHPRFKEVKKARKDAQELRKMAGQYKRNFGKEEREQRRLVYKEAKQVAQYGIGIEDYIIESLIEKAQIITTTLVGANHRYLQNQTFDTVVIDEAGQAPEPASWIPILKGKRVILAGDPYQLPPTIKSQEAQKKGLEISLMEQGIKNIEEVSLLDTQYRMNELIMNFSNQQFYDNELKAHETVKSQLLTNHELAVEFIDTVGCSFDEKQVENSTSLHNPEEGSIIQKHLAQLAESSPIDEYSLGIISPYKAQVEYLKEIIEVGTVNTIDSFQGQERDIIYISLVRSNEGGEIGFLKDYRRMNVAMTRAKKKLVIVGDSATLANDSFYNQLVDYCSEIGAYRSAWEFA
ncbi:MAG: AAA family ATPase [Cytophagales bacterium]|nr:AAA family ATPase [Cytophagales bacterium]